MTRTGLDIYDDRIRGYITAARVARVASPEILARYRTVTCPECDEVPGPGADGVILADDGDFAHYVLDGSVLVGCEGFCVVDPRELGCDSPGWQDWRTPPAPPTGPLTPKQLQAITWAMQRETDTGGITWDEMKDRTVENLCAVNQDALLDDWFEAAGQIPGEQRAEILALIRLYDGLLGTDRAAIEIDRRAR